MNAVTLHPTFMDGRHGQASADWRLAELGHERRAETTAKLTLDRATLAELVMIGFAHQHATLALREKLRIDDGNRRALLAELSNLTDERLVLGTCERFEVYTYSAEVDAGSYLDLFADFFGVSLAALHDQARVLRGDRVADHLLRVAAGLESRIIGEPQILGQVRRAFLAAQQEAALGPVLSALGRSAIHAGKRVRKETPINATARSSATLAVERMERDLGSLLTQTVLILGTGKLARDVAVALTVRRPRRMLVASRQPERAWELASNFNGEGLAVQDLSETIKRCDAVIACSTSTQYLLDHSMMDAGRATPLSIVDLGVPRNVDPRVAEFPGIRLTYLDDLAGSDCNPHEGQAAADAVLAEELDRFLLWQRQRRAVPMIAELVREAESQPTVDGRVMKRALHHRIVRLKEAVAA